MTIETGRLKFRRISNLNKYLAHEKATHSWWQPYLDIQNSYVPATQGPFEINGYCVACDAIRQFKSSTPGGEAPNWREELVCSHCRLNNRYRCRATYHFLKSFAAADSSMYVTELKTDFYQFLTTKYFNLTGSEYFEGKEEIVGAEPGHQDLTGLTFEDSSFDVVVSQDVLEHVPDYRTALAEIHRCLKLGGTFALTVPFAELAKETLVRATVHDGEIVHLVESEFHGDPLRSEGCLAFYTFSWPLLDDLREIGFRDVFANLYWSREYCYFGGGEQLLISARA